MYQVDKESVLKALHKKKLLYLNEYKTIQDNNPNFTIEIFTDDGTHFLMVQTQPYSFRSLLNYDRRFFDLAIKQLKAMNFMGNIAVTLPYEKAAEIEELRPMCEKVTGYRTFAGFCETKGYKQNSRIKKLNKSDRSFIDGFDEESHKNMPCLKDSFDELVIEQSGEIFSYFDEKNQIAGYLSCCEEFENIWDVIYIYVSPKNRSKGIGTALATHYLNEKLANNQIPYYSGVTDPASANAALKAGFEPCGMIYNLKLV